MIVRSQEGLAEILQFVVEGLEIGQQVVAMAGPSCLKHLACTLSESGLRPETMLHNGRLVFLTAPDWLSRLSKPEDPLQRTPLRRNGPLLRWVSDWSWAYADGRKPSEILAYQHSVHDFVRSVDALSLCTIHSHKLERGSLLAALADHRRAARARATLPLSAHIAVPSA